MTNLDAPVPPPLPKQPRGCLFYFGITAIVLLLVFGVGGYFLVRYGIDRVVTTIEQYSETEPMSLPGSAMTDADYRQLEQRVAQFTAADANGAAAPELVLSSDDVNALIARHPAWQLARGKMHVTLAGDQVQALVALPLAGLADSVPGFSRLKGRFVNADLGLQVSIANEHVDATLRSVTVKGEPMPAEFRAALQGQNLLERLAGPEVDKLQQRIASLRVEGDRLLITRKVN